MEKINRPQVSTMSASEVEPGNVCAYKGQLYMRLTDKRVVGLKENWHGFANLVEGTIRRLPGSVSVQPIDVMLDVQEPVMSSTEEVEAEDTF